jgi:hypothetical protein
MHALKGNKQKHYTFTVSIMVGSRAVTALIDNGSTTTFMTPAFATKANCSLVPSKRIGYLL